MLGKFFDLLQGITIIDKTIYLLYNDYMQFYDDDVGIVIESWKWGDGIVSGRRESSINLKYVALCTLS